MPDTRPTIIPDMNLEGDAALWQEVEYYMANKDDHTKTFSRTTIRRMIEFLYKKANTGKKERRMKQRRIRNDLYNNFARRIGLLDRRKATSKER